MGQVKGKVRVTCYVYPETKEILQGLAIGGGFRARSGLPDIGSAIDAIVVETAQRARTFPKEADPTWTAQAEALVEREHQREIRRKAASKVANARRRSSERSIRYIDPDD
jgi:hypothetical protein